LCEKRGAFRDGVRTCEEKIESNYYDDKSGEPEGIAEVVGVVVVAHEVK